MKIKDPEIQKHFVCSTIHIKEEDTDILENANIESGFISADEYPYGWSIYIHEQEEKGFKKAILKEGYSEEFYNLLIITRELGCEYLRLDRDGPEYDEIPKFNW